MKKTTVILMVIAGWMVSVFAEFIENPDENTLWIEDGKEVAFAENAKKGVWGGSLDVEERPGGGFSFVYKDVKKYCNGIYVPIDPEYPYLVAEIDSFKRTNHNYRMFSFGRFQYGSFPASPSFLPIVTMVDNPQPGLFVWNPFGETVPKANKHQYFRNDMHGLKVDFKYVKMVKEPDNYIIIECETMKSRKALNIGDEIKCTVKLKEPAEDVTLRFYNSYFMAPVNLNHKGALQLKPIDKKNPTVWTATIKINSFGKNKIKTGYLLARATVLGGGISIPIWMPIPYPFDPTVK